MKKLITLLLTVVLSASCFLGCKPANNSSTPDSTPDVSAPESSTPDSSTPDSSTPDSSTPDESSTPDSSMPDISIPEEGEEFYIDFELEASHSVLTYDTTPLDTTGRAKRSESGYTYRGATTTLPNMWNVHNYQSNDATTVLGYTEDGLFEFDYNQAMNGYRIVPGMAASYPVDVTSQFAGKYGIDNDTTSGYAYKITLRQDLKFDNGDAITAEDFVESMKRLLDGDLANYRADSYYSGNLKIYNAENYFYSGQEILVDSLTKYNYDAEGEWANADKSKLYFSLGKGESYVGSWLASSYSQYEPAYVLYKGYGVAPQADIEALYGKTYAEIEADPALKATWDAIITWWQTEPNEEFHFFAVKSQKPETPWSDVGYFADENDPYSFYIVLAQELSGFYLLYSISGSMSLVHTETYDQYITEEQGIKTCTYATSKESYVGFGPYRISEYHTDSSLKFERNPHWYGYALSVNDTYYHTSNIEYKVVDDASLKNEFLAGNTDSYSLKPEDMADYQGSKHTYFTDGDSTWFVAINPNYAGLKAAQEITAPSAEGIEVNKTVLTIKEFRQAMSFSIDRAAYALALDPLGGTAKALYGNMIVSDAEQGIAYRTTTQAKDTILKFWGLYEEVQELGFADGQFATRDDAIASITGYDLAGAKALFTEAYAIAVADGHISAEAAASGKWEVAIIIGQPGNGSSAYYNNGYELLKKVWTDAVVGTPFEGHLVFTQSEPLGSTNFSDFLKRNEVDVLFGVGWTGSTLDPYGLMEAYVSPNYQYDPGWDTTKTTLDIEIEGYVLRASVYAWGVTALNGGSIQAYIVDEDGNVTADYVVLHAGTTCKAEIRLQILAAVECAVLEQYDMIPINLDSSANLKGMKIKYGTEEYVFGVGRGGIKYMTYNYSDAEWAAFVAGNVDENNQLNYK